MEYIICSILNLENKYSVSYYSEALNIIYIIRYILYIASQYEI